MDTERIDNLILLSPGSLEGKERTEGGRDHVLALLRLEYADAGTLAEVGLEATREKTASRGEAQ